MKKFFLFICLIVSSTLSIATNIRVTTVKANLLSVTGVIYYSAPYTSITNPMGIDSYYNTYKPYYTLDAQNNDYKVDLDGDGVYDIEFTANYYSVNSQYYSDPESGGFDYNIKITGNQPSKKIAFLDAKSYTGGSFLSLFDTSLFKNKYVYHMDVVRRLGYLGNSNFPPPQQIYYRQYGSNNINFLGGSNRFVPFYFQKGDSIFFGRMLFNYLSPLPYSIELQTIAGLPYYIYDATDENNGNFLTNSFFDFLPYRIDFTNLNLKNYRMVVCKMVNGNCDWMPSSNSVSIPYNFSNNSCDSPHPQLFTTPSCTSQVKQDLIVMLLPKTTTSIQLNYINYRDLQSCYGFYYTLTFCNNSSLKIDIDTSKVVNYINPIPIKYALSNGISIAAASTPKRKCRSNLTNVVITTPQSGQIAKITYPHEVIPISSIPPWNKKNGDTLYYSSLVPNSLFKIEIIDSVSCSNNVLIGSSNSIKAQLYLPGTLSITSDLRISGQCADSIFKVNIVNRGSSMNDSTKYYIYENGLLTFSDKIKLSAKDTFKFDVKADGNCILVRVDEEPTNPLEKYEIAEIEGCGGYKEIGKNRFVNRPMQQLVGYATYIINNSNDPNSKEVIPIGLGANQQVLMNTPLTYTINFQNTGNDTAYSVKIIDTLSLNLNPKTLKVLFASHNYTTSISGCKLLFDFPGIKLVDSIHNERKSHGFIRFQINPIAGLPNRTSVKNMANIYFDMNSPVSTNEVLTTYVNKLDTLVDSNIVKIYTKILLTKDTVIFRYGDSAKTINYKSNINKLQVVGSIADSSVSIFTSNVNLKPKNAGTTYFTLSSTGTYKFYPAYAQGQINVVKAGLSVVADSLQKLNNTPNPNFKYHFNGLKNGDLTNSILGSPQFSTSADSTSPIGNYPIMISEGTLSSRNYDFSFINGNLRVLLNCTKFQSCSIQPSIVSVCPNIPVTFTATTDGLISYTWSDGSTNPYLTTTAPGMYSLTITGACGTKTPNPASLTNIPQTNITSQPISSSKCIDSSATFTVLATGSGLNYQWNQGSNTSIMTTSIPGIYTVTVSGTCGTEVSNSVQLSSINTCSGTVTTISSNQEIPSLQIFPNPTNGLITIQSDEVRDFKIMDGIGSVIKNGILKQGRNLINLELVQGIYYFSSNEIVKKLVVE